MLPVLFTRWRATVSCLLVLLALGIVSFYEIPKQAEADIDVPIMHVSIEQTGIEAHDADQLLVRPLAQALRSIDGVKELRSSAYSGGATLTLEFKTPLLFGDAFDAERAHALVNEQLERVETDLPAAAKKPRLQQVNLSQLPLLVVSLLGDVPEIERLRYARALRDRLATLPSITNTILSPDRDEIVEVAIDPIVLSSYQLDAQTIYSIVDRANRAPSGGGVDTQHGRVNLSFTGQFESLYDILNLPIKTSADSVLRLRDIASVRRTLADANVISRHNGQPATTIALSKRLDADVIETLQEIRRTVDESAKSWPRQLRAAYSQDRSMRIRMRMSELNNALIVAVILVIGVLIASLGFRNGLLVGLSIPASFLLATLGLGLLGISINTAVLFAFVMSVGLLVDGAIVMVEHADRLMAQGASARDAYLAAVRRMWLPVATSTVITLTAFAPLLVWPGVIGEYMKFFPLTMLLTLSASLLMALIFIPVIGSIVGANDESPARPLQHSGLGPTWIVREYTALLAWTLRHPGWTMGLAIASLVASTWLYTNYGRNVELLPKSEPSGALILVRADGDLALPHKRELALEVERLVRRYADFETVRSDIGSVSRSADLIAKIEVEFRPWNEHAPGEEILQVLENDLAQLAGVHIEIRPHRDGPSQAKPILVNVTAGSQTQLDHAVAQVRRYVESIPGTKGVEDSRPNKGIEWRLEIDQAQAARFAIDVATIEQYIRFVTRGLVLGKISPQAGSDLANDKSTSGISDTDIDIVLRFPSRYRNIEGLRAIRVHTAHGEVPLDQFTQLLPVARDSKVERLEGLLSRTVTADVEYGVLESNVVRDVRALLGSAVFAVGTQIHIRGENEERDDARDFLFYAFLTTLFVIALVLIAQFNSFYCAIVILFSIVLSSVGVRIGLVVMDMPFGIVMSGIGIIALLGIVVNNNIIIIDTYTQLRGESHNAYDALIRTGQMRLRPILLTSITTIIGLLPMVLLIDIDFAAQTFAIGSPAAQYWVQMSSAIVFGLAFATLFTLFVTPAALIMRDNISVARAREKDKAESESIRRAFEQHGPVIGISAFTAIVAAWFFIPQVIAIRLIDIFGKQIFERVPSSWFQALESSGFYSLIMLGAAYAYWRNDHVRVDIIRERLSARGKATIELVGFFLLLLPVCLVILIPGAEIVLDSIHKEETSGALMGTPTLWIFKAMMLLCFAQLLAIGVYVSWKNIRVLRGLESEPYPLERSPLDPSSQSKIQ